MKNKFLPQRLLQFSLLFANTICYHTSSLSADTYINSKNAPTSWVAGKNSGIDNADSSLNWLNESASQQKYVSKGKGKATAAQGGYQTPGQMLFSIDSPSNNVQSTINSSLTRKLQSNAPKNASIAQNDQPASQSNREAVEGTAEEQKTVLINFNNISIIEYIRFVSRITNRNFVFDENDLQFNVTIISEEPANLENIMTALLQELRIHDLTMFEQGNNIIIHRNSKVNAISNVVSDDASRLPQNSDIVTQVFRLNTVRPGDVATVIRPLTSEYALVEVLEGSNHLIITDLSTNVMQIAKLIKSVDAPASGLVIGQYVVKTTAANVLIDMAKAMLAPISQEQPLTMMSWDSADSIFVVSTPFLVERALSILQHLDQNEKSTRVFDLNEFRFKEAAPQKGALPAGLYVNNQPFKAAGVPLPGEGETMSPGKWFKDTNGRWSLPLGRGFGGSKTPPNGQWKLDKNGHWYFEPSNAPPSQGKWRQDQDGNWLFTPSEEPSGDGAWKKDEDGNWYFEPGPGPLEGGKWVQDANGKWHFEPGSAPSRFGTWKQDPYGNWYLQGFPGFVPEGEKQGEQPAGHWYFDPLNGWIYELNQGESFRIKRLIRQEPENAPTPFGAKQKAQFYVYKVKFRRGDTIQNALNAIADSISSSGLDNEELLATLTSVQWIDTSNSLIFTGLEENLLKMRELMEDVDVPLRQVFIEMLILETSMNDSLEYGVTWGSRFGGGNWAGGQTFQTDLSPIGQALNATGNPAGLGNGVNNTLLNSANTTASAATSNLGTGLVNITPVRVGWEMGVIGQTIINTSLGLQFNSIGALLNALRTKINTNVILSPKIITEDNVPAEIFVGENVSFKTQSLANDQNNTITNNFEYRDVGTRLRVTPTIGNNDVIALEIATEISRLIPSTIPTSNSNNSPGPSTTKSTTTTRVHLPNGYFLVISGMMNDETDRFTTQVPCLGAIPVLGAAFKDKRYDDLKRNQMIFLRPRIIDTEEELQNLTKHEQDVWDYKSRRKKDWIYETEEAFEFMNLKRDIVEADPEIADRDN